MITSKQRSVLKAHANKIEPIFQLGKGGITENFIRQIDEALEARELIKLTVLRNASFTAKDAMNKLAEAVGAEPVTALGSKIILYRRSKTKAEHIEI